MYVIIWVFSRGREELFRLLLNTLVYIIHSILYVSTHICMQCAMCTLPLAACIWFRVACTAFRYFNDIYSKVYFFDLKFSFRLWSRVERFSFRLFIRRKKNVFTVDEIFMFSIVSAKSSGPVWLLVRYRVPLKTRFSDADFEVGPLARRRRRTNNDRNYIRFVAHTV